MSMDGWFEEESGKASRYPLNSADLVEEHLNRISGEDAGRRDSEEIMGIMEELDWTPQPEENRYYDDDDPTYEPFDEEIDYSYQNTEDEEEESQPSARSSFSSIGNKFKGAKATVQKLPQSFVPKATGLASGARRSLGRGVAVTRKAVVGRFQGMPTEQKEKSGKTIEGARSNLKPVRNRGKNTPVHYNKPPPGTHKGVGNKNPANGSVSQLAGQYDTKHYLQRAKGKPVLKTGGKQTVVKPTLKIKKTWNPRQKWDGKPGKWEAKP